MNVSSYIHPNRTSCARSPRNLSEHLLLVKAPECRSPLVHSPLQTIHCSKFNSAVVKWSKLNFYQCFCNSIFGDRIGKCQFYVSRLLALFEGESLIFYKENNNLKNLIMTLFLRSNIKIIKLKNCLNC